jgi:hypothetical protein
MRFGILHRHLGTQMKEKLKLKKTGLSKIKIGKCPYFSLYLKEGYFLNVLNLNGYTPERNNQTGM